MNVGHGRKELAEVAKVQMEKLAYVIPVMTSDPAVELSEKMLEKLGMDKGHVYFTSSGSEANETAFKMVRQYHLQTGNPRKHKIISRHRAYHGNTLATMTATGQAERKIGYEPLALGFLPLGFFFTKFSMLLSGGFQMIDFEYILNDIYFFAS